MEEFYRSYIWKKYIDNTHGPLCWIYNEDIKFEGSCIVVSHLDRLYIVTAEHVIGNSEVIHIPKMNSDVEPENPLGVEVWRVHIRPDVNYWKDSENDLAILEIANLPYKSIIPLSLQDFDDEISTDAWVQYCGFTKSETNQLYFGRKEKPLSHQKNSKIYIYPFHLLQPIYRIEKNHFYVEFPKKLPKYSETTGDWPERLLPSPKGLSGSGIWKCDAHLGSSNTCIFGIAVFYDDARSLIRATKARLVLDLFKTVT